MAVGGGEMAVGSWELVVIGGEKAVGSGEMVVGSGYMAVIGGEMAVGSGDVAVRTVMAPADVESLNINKVKNYAVFTFFRKFAAGKHKTE